MAQREELILDVTAKLDQAMRDVQALQAQIDALATTTEATVTVTADDKATEVVSGVTGEVEALDGAEASVTLDADDDATDTVEDAAAAVGDLDGETAEITVEADDEATDTIEEVADAAGELDGETVEIVVETNADEATEGLGGVSSALDDVIAKLGKFAGPAGFAGAITAGLGAATTAAYDFTQQVEELSGFTGSSTEEASRLLAVMQDFGALDISQVETMIARVVDKMAEMPELADQLGIDASQGPLDLFVATIDALNSDQISAAEQIALSTEIFGRRGVKAVNEIATSVGNVREQMEGIGDERVMSDEDLAAANEMEDAVAAMKGEFHELTIALGQDFIPLLAQAADLAAKIIEGISPPEGQTIFGGISNEDVGRLDDANDAIQEMTSADFGGGDFGPTADDIERMAGSAEDYARALQLGQQAAADFEAEQDRLTITSEELGDAVLALQDPLETLPFLWDILIKKYREGTLESGTAEAAINQLAEATGVAADEIPALVAAESDLRDQELAAELEAQAAAAELLGEAVRQAGIEMGTAASRAAGIGEAFDRLDESSGLTNTIETLGIARDFKTALEELGDVDLTKTPLIQTDWPTLLDEDLGQAVEAVAGLRESLQGEMAQAFAKEGPEGLREWADSTRAGIESALRGTGDFTETEITHILDQLGLLEEDVEISIKMAEQEQVLAALGTITSGIEGLPASVAFDVQMAINNNDPATAIDLINGYLASIGEDPISIAVTDDGTIQDLADAADTATEDRDAHVIVPKSPSLGQMETLLNAVAREREVKFNAKSDNAGGMDRLLDGVAADRNAEIWVRLPNYGEINRDLEQLARDRHSNIIVHRVGGGGGGGAASEPTAAGFAAPTAGLMTAPMTAEGELGVATLAAPAVITSSSPGALVPPGATVTNNLNVTVQAAVIGNPHEVDRAVSRALRRYNRLNGGRN